MKYVWIREHTVEFPVAPMCRVLEVSRSGYYGWLKRGLSERAKRRELIALAAKESHQNSNEVYGYRKVHEDLVQDMGIKCCMETVRKTMKQLGLRSKVAGKFVVTTDSRHSRPVAENLLEREFTAAGPNQKWVADITYVRTREGWAYLAAVMDLWSRNIVGWSLSKTIDSGLVCEALNKAIRQRCPTPQLIHHSDRGIQYACEQFQQLLGLHAIQCSMSRKGDCWDNAPAESFFGKLKTEHICGRVYRDLSEAEQQLFWYIEVFYNRKRRHAALGYLSPLEFEKRGLGKQAA